MLGVIFAGYSILECSEAKWSRPPKKLMCFQRKAAVVWITTIEKKVKCSTGFDKKQQVKTF